MSSNRCSQIRTTLQPSFLKRARTVRSRFRFRSIFRLQYSTLELGMRLQVGHPCQKQPSTRQRDAGPERQNRVFRARHPRLTSSPEYQPEPRPNADATQLIDSVETELAPSPWSGFPGRPCPSQTSSRAGDPWLGSSDCACITGLGCGNVTSPSVRVIKSVAFFLTH